LDFLILGVLLASGFFFPGIRTKTTHAFTFFTVRATCLPFLSSFL
jgi:hypothetical protein